MWNVMKAQLYQLKKNRLIPAVFLMILLVQYTTAIGEMNYWEGQMTGGKYLASNGLYMSLLAMMFVFVLIGELCGGDFKDRTSSCEVLAGHSRKDVYFGRAILSLIIGAIGVSVLVVFSVAMVSMQSGWGEELELKWVAIRGVLLLFPILRLMCEFICLTFFVKNPYIAMAGGFFVFLAGQMLSQNALVGSPMFHAVTNMNILLNFETWETYSLLNGRSMQVYQSSLEITTMIGTIAASLVFGLLFLIMGYIFFKNDDLN